MTKKPKKKYDIEEEKAVESKEALEVIYTYIDEIEDIEHFAHRLKEDIKDFLENLKEFKDKAKYL